MERPFRGWKSFVSNRVKRIKQITDEIEIKWKPVPTKMNYADAGSKGVSYRQNFRKDELVECDIQTSESIQSARSRKLSS